MTALVLQAILTTFCIYDGSGVSRGCRIGLATDALLGILAENDIPYTARHSDLCLQMTSIT